MNVIVIAVALLTLALSAAMLRRRWRNGGWAVTAGLIVLSLVSAAVLVSASYNMVASAYFVSRHPGPGQLLAVEGSRMHLVCAGQGEPTLVLEAGAGDGAEIWAAVQERLSRLTRVCAYDRAGMGLSEPVPGPRDAVHIADQLHALLGAAHVKGRFVLAAHSIGGLYARAYAGRYPRDLAGLVLIDATPPFVDQDPIFAGEQSLPPRWLAEPILAAGIPRLLGMCSAPTASMTAEQAKLRAERFCAMRYGEFADEYAVLNQSSHEVSRHLPGGVPLLVLSHDDRSAAPENAKSARVRRRWSELQEGERALSPSSRRVIAAGSTHYIMLDRRDLVVDELARLVRALRTGQVIGNEPTLRR